MTTEEILARSVIFQKETHEQLVKSFELLQRLAAVTRELAEYLDAFDRRIALLESQL